MKSLLLAWGVFKRDGEFLAASASRSDARNAAVKVKDAAGRKAVVKRISLKVYELDK